MAWLYNFHCFDHLYLTGIYNYGAQIWRKDDWPLYQSVHEKRNMEHSVYSLHCVRTIKAKKNKNRTWWRPILPPAWGGADAPGVTFIFNRKWSVTGGSQRW